MLPTPPSSISRPVRKPQRHSKFREIKAASGRRSALELDLGFRRPFHPDCEYGEESVVSEVLNQESRTFYMIRLIDISRCYGCMLRIPKRWHGHTQNCD